MLTEKLKQEMLEHAKYEYPKECCGLLVTNEHSVKYVPCNNISDNPTETFEIDTIDIISIGYEYEIVGIVHSHSNGKNYLSKYDMLNQKLSNLDWYLIANNDVKVYRPIELLVGRNFEFNKQDCYNLFRDCYMLAGIDFPEFSYVENWYELGQNLYVDNLQKYDFEQVKEPQLGDVILFQVGSEIPNHCGVYVGNQMFVHHSINQLSKRDMLGGYWLKHTHSIWRYKWKSQLNFMAILENTELNSN